MHNDIATALDTKSGVVLIMLDLSSAFDTIDHDILLERFDTHYGIRGSALKVIESYFKGRTQSVTISGETSEKRIVKRGVPQGSGFGPEAYGMYSKPVGGIIRLHKMDYHIYADDGQIYLVISLSCDMNWIVTSLENCVGDICHWMTHNLLKLNEEKTELIYFQSKLQKQAAPTPPLRIGSNIITPVKDVKNLGCYLDSQLTMESRQMPS